MSAFLASATALIAVAAANKEVRRYTIRDVEQLKAQGMEPNAYPHFFAANYNIGSASSADAWIAEFTGKLRVPDKGVNSWPPKVVIFYWPGLDITGSNMGLVQPVLTVGPNGPAPSTKEHQYTMGNWYEHCENNVTNHGDGADYCHDKYYSLREGDVLNWYMRRLNQSQTEFPMDWECGYTVEGKPDLKSHLTFKAWNGTQDAAGLVLESRADDSECHVTSPVIAWDFTIKDQFGKSYEPEWSWMITNSGYPEVKLHKNYNNASLGVTNGLMINVE